DLWYDLRLFESTALPIVDTTWDLQNLEQAPAWQIIHPHGEAARAQSAARCAAAALAIQSALGSTTTSRCAAAFLLHPQLWQPAYTHGRHYYDHGYVQSALLGRVAAACLEQQLPTDWAAWLCKRIMSLCGAANVGGGADLDICVQYLLACDEAI